MCGNTDKDFNHRSKIRFLGPFRVFNSTQGKTRVRVYLYRIQGEPRLQRKGEDSRELVMIRK